MARTSILLLDSTVGLVNSTGNAVKGSAYYNTTDSKSTIAIYTQHLDGRLTIQASLSSCPTDSDWFDIEIYPTRETIYVEFTNDTSVTTYNFAGNYVFLRANIDKSYLENPSDPAHGYISKILLNY